MASASNFIVWREKIARLAAESDPTMADEASQLSHRQLEPLYRRGMEAEEVYQQLFSGHGHE
ncbi:MULTISPECIES: hypothetical protein [Corallincola]|uniref:Uncharacterized protein n=3 Tax=Corallincola TaxID=1775176 RepID=A0A368NS04_9GAMM|nr:MULTISPECIES: hypothetical protein [Corallincola]RCU52890.1 hypothetical protein DU002_02700 [Corallincola holothuriorum]TAA47956.1 hypothetical protein EXY25_01550 [Corallincola spongiicola]TCI03387.1 hypothetical protein EZV61_10980 [Corallincola luteus]